MESKNEPQQASGAKRARLGQGPLLPLQHQLEPSLRDPLRLDTRLNTLEDVHEANEALLVARAGARDHVRARRHRDVPVEDLHDHLVRAALRRVALVLRPRGGARQVLRGAVAADLEEVREGLCGGYTDMV